MTIERDNSFQSICMRLNAKNYSYSSYVIQNFLKGKRMRGYIIDTLHKPRNKKMKNMQNS